ncbi:esterase [Superficieibacter electus]|uniref:Esterase n=1 Tax=Superficieibacter electus TaxID=2022662 RepID=A0A2P5GIJ4_9ENTR|nr:esterase [Superficieibacter electus]POP41039.1 esterase [Superficieibacter electus]POP42933.1 esterase [Superficieibacter electus]
MIELDVRTLANIEILHAFPSGKGNQPLPCIVFYHGFTSSKLVYSYFAVALAQAGFRVVMPDAREHGARYQGDEQGRMQHFWQILQENFHEFSALRDAIVAQGWVDGQRLAVAGASMGGMTALGLMTQHPEITCVACLMGSGYFMQLSRTLFPAQEEQPALARWDVTQQLPALANRPLLLWHGEEDDVVPAVETLRLQQALSSAGLDQHLTCQWQAGVRHRITPEALSATVAFFNQHL